MAVTTIIQKYMIYLDSLHRIIWPSLLYVLESSTLRSHVEPPRRLAASDLPRSMGGQLRIWVWLVGKHGLPASNSCEQVHASSTVYMGRMFHVVAGMAHKKQVLLSTRPWQLSTLRDIFRHRVKAYRCATRHDLIEPGSPGYTRILGLQVQMDQSSSICGTATSADVHL